MRGEGSCPKSSRGRAKKSRRRIRDRWGYGGNTCHPTTVAQPFAESTKSGANQFTCSCKNESKHWAEDLICEVSFRLTETNWKPIPENDQVRGSRYAPFASRVSNKRSWCCRSQTPGRYWRWQRAIGRAATSRGRSIRHALRSGCPTARSQARRSRREIQIDLKSRN